jgi:hypothetical protein
LALEIKEKEKQLNSTGPNPAQAAQLGQKGARARARAGGFAKIPSGFSITGTRSFYCFPVSLTFCTEALEVLFLRRGGPRRRRAWRDSGEVLDRPIGAMAGFSERRT